MTRRMGSRPLTEAFEGGLRGNDTVFETERAKWGQSNFYLRGLRVSEK